MAMENDLTIKKKYLLYEKSVQNPESDIEFVNDEYKKRFKRRPLLLREDFGGTGYLACEWAKQSENHKSWAIDLDNEPIQYGRENHYARLLEEEKKRMTYLEGDVLVNHGFKTDIVVAFNFSYFIFKKRNDLLNYFKKAHEALNDEGMFFVDIFGGTESYTPQVEETEHEDFSYFWDLEKYNPLTNECLYYIHFESKEGKKRYEQVFTYDWRMWTPQEVKEIMEEAGFNNVKTYWEGEDGDGEGDGEFYESSDEENCESWVTYVIGEK